MTTYANHTVNAAGLSEIAAFLAAHHKKGGDHHFTADMLIARAADAARQLGDGNTATIEIRSWDTVSGHTETYTISEAGIDTEVVEIDE